MSVADATGRRPLLLGPAATLAAAVVAVVSAALIVDAWRGGLRYGGTSPPIQVLLPVAVCATAGAAWWLAERSVRPLARWMAACSAALCAYLAAAAAAAQYAGQRGQRGVAADLLVATHNAAAVVPVALLQLCFLATLTMLAGPTQGVRRLRTALVALIAAYFLAVVVFVTPGRPYVDIRPIWDAPTAEIITDAIGTVIWISVVLIGPVLVWRGAARARGEVRRRLSLLAACAMAPVVTVTFCIVGMSLVRPSGLLSELHGESVLAFAYAAPFVIAAAGVPAVVHPQLVARMPELVPKIVTATVTVIVSGLFGIVVVTVSALLGARFGPDQLLTIVVLTVLVAAALAPLRARVGRRLTLGIDPARAAAARLRANLDDAALARPASTVQAVLRESLADPSARLVIKLPEEDGWVDITGAPVPTPDPKTAPAPRPGSVSVLHSGPPGDAAGVVAELRSLIDQAVLEVTVREQSRKIAAEKERADAAAVAERRRLERDLHDGLQGRLLALALDLHMAQRDLADGAAQLVLTDATDRLQQAIGELRTLASGASPEMLSRDGLGPALAELVRRVPVRLAVSVPDDRLSPPVETVAYLVICEAVTNALKHADAQQIDVRVAATGSTAVIEVSDDGRGGADLRAGAGLRGMSERVGAAGGQLIVSDRQPHGTKVEVVLPCES